MTKIIYVEAGGTRHVLDVPVGQTVMHGAVQNDIPGIPAECGGACACATCHVYVDEAWLGQINQPSEAETAMLSFAENVRSNSRLSCQIQVSAELDGLTVYCLEDA